MDIPERLFPNDILARASLRGNEYAWSINTIPEVIDAAETANLVSIGGQLQFRLPDGGICECYWVEVDPLRDCPKTLGRTERVHFAAAAARQQFDDLKRRYDFVNEGKNAFGEVLSDLEANGGSISDAMCFVWYVETAEAYSNSTMT